MSKILFIPTQSRQIAQFSLVKPELETMGHEIVAIVLDKSAASDASGESMEVLLHKKEFHYKRLTDYKTRNIVSIVRKENPDIIVTVWSGFIPNAFIYAADYAEIPCLQINDGITGDYFSVISVPTTGQSVAKLARRAFRLIAFQANPCPLIYLFTTLAAIYHPSQFVRMMMKELLKSTYPIPSYTKGLKIAVVSAYAKEAHIKMGAPADKIFVTGQPRFDLIWQAKVDKAQVMIELKMLKEKDIIVLATQPLGELRSAKEQREFLEVVVGAVSEFPENQLVIKLHPDEKIEEYQKMLVGIINSVIICRDIDLYGLLHACELLMTVHSTVALEAMILDKPVITVNLTGKPDVMPYAESGAALGVYRKEDLAPTINKALYDNVVRKRMAGKREQFVYEHAYKLDGQATKRVADLIVRLIEESKKKEGVIT